MAKIKLIVRKMSFLAIASSFLLISCNRNNEIHNDEIKTIKIAVSEGQKNYFTMLIDRFEELYSNKYKIEVKLFENNSIINYYLSHDYLDVDIVAFDNLNTANFYGEYLQTLNRFDAIGNYQSSISDYLRTSSGKINVIPGPGDLYTYCYNTDLLAKRNFKIPTTVSELTETAKRMGSYDYPCVMIDDGITPLRVSVNVSRSHLMHKNFLDEYFKLMENYNVPPKYIEFELTESLVMENSEILVEIINQIHKFGCPCSIDDFGSGYSSLNMLKEFDFDVIKLDQVFFRGSNGFDDKAKKIVHSVIELCHTLNKTIVAEGVENKEIVNYLKKEKCAIIQGYYFSKPVPYEDYMTQVKKQSEEEKNKINDK